MAAGLDELLEFLLSEIALCGTQGASSTDFRRFVQTYYRDGSACKPGIENGARRSLPHGGLGPVFFDRVWHWTTTHPDIRITHNHQTRHYTLAEFEAAETAESLRIAVGGSDDLTSSTSLPLPKLQPAESLLALRAALRQRLSGTEPVATHQHHATRPPVDTVDQGRRFTRHRHRILPESSFSHGAMFDEPTASTSAPRLFASQNRIWQALTGHSLDLKKVPTMEFTLLSLIAAHGANGIAQPDLVQFSGQDKRSVPHRTDELARKGYIIKKPVQAGKARTSLCVHTKFVSQNHFTTSGTVEDAFQPGTFVASSFVLLLYNTFKDAGVVLTRDLRQRMGVPMQTWNKRAVAGALVRLDQSGMIRRFQIRKNKAKDVWVTCIQIQREPRPEDLENLGFRRQAPVADTTDELIQNDMDGDTFMRNFEVDLLEDGDYDNARDDDMDETARVPPQWTPDRLLSNTIFDFVTLGQTSGWDALVLRDRVVGPYWRRPVESYLTRLTDDWERMQPAHLRHLAIIRDTRTSDEKRFVHYVYRAYRYFQEAVRIGEADWGGVCKPASKTEKAEQKLRSTQNIQLDMWGFRFCSQKDFVRFNGTATLSDVRSAISGPRKYGPRWDIPLAKGIGYDRPSLPPSTTAAPRRPQGTPTTPDRNKKLSSDQAASDSGNDEHSDEQSATLSVLRKPRTSKAKKVGSGLTLTPEQRESLGLKPSGRLSKSAAKQILAHRRETGDSTSLPEKLIDEPILRAKAPLMTKEERMAENLPLKGRLGLDKENEIREKRGLPKLVEKARKKRGTKEPAILTKQQRIKLGFKDHGRLHQWFIDDLRREQENEIPIESSPAVKKYREYLAGGGRKDGTLPTGTTSPSHEARATEQTTIATGDLDQKTLGGREVDEESPLPKVATPGKRKADSVSTPLPVQKRPRTKSTGSKRVSHDKASSSAGAELGLMQNENAPKPSDDPTMETAMAQEKRKSDALPTTPDAVRNDQSSNQTVTSRTIEDETGSSTEHSTQLSPGLYIHPAAKRKVSRGRPRNAFIAIFRTPRLRDLPWFSEDASSGSSSTHAVFMGPCKQIFGQRNDLERTVTSAESLDSIRSINRRPSAQVSEIQSEPIEHDEAPSGLRKESAVPQTTAEIENTDQRREQNTSLTGVRRDELYGSELPVPAEAVSAHPVSAGIETQQWGPTRLSLAQSTPSIRSEVERGKMTHTSVVEGDPMGASTQVKQPSYQSPYAPAAAVGLGEQFSNVDTSNSPSLETNIPRLDTQGTSELPEGVVGEILEKEDAEIAAYREALAKTNKRAAEGSTLKFRRAIILDIIDRCGGVYPLHGEIGRPFRALWNMRHGHTNLRMPENSTVQDTLKNMISNPVFGLKRMAFQVKARNATGRKLRAIVARSDIAHNDPRVMKLAYNMANNSTDKANQFFPEQIRDVFEYETMYIPPPVAPKDESLTLAQLFPEIENSIRENKLRRRRERVAQKKAEKEAAKRQNEQVEKVIPKRSAQAKSQSLQAQSVTREKRARLASLNDKTKRYRRAPVQISILEDLEEEGSRQAPERDSSTNSDISGDVPLKDVRSLHMTSNPEGDWSKSKKASLSQDERIDLDSVDDTDQNTTHAQQCHINHTFLNFHPLTGTFSTLFQVADTLDGDTRRGMAATVNHETESSSTTFGRQSLSILHSIVRFHAVTGTFATFLACSGTENRPADDPVPTIGKSVSYASSKKRKLIPTSATNHINKKARKTIHSRKETLDEEFIYRSAGDSDATTSEDEEEEPQMSQKQKQKRRRKTISKRQLGKNLPTPTLLERLTGLTGDPGDPIYKDPKVRSGPGSGRPWAEQKKKKFDRQRKGREYAETLDEVDQFKKLCLTLALASSMSGEDGTVNWSIVEKVYSCDAFFDLSRSKKLWAWLRDNRAAQLNELVDTLQTDFLTAYDAGRLPSIEDPETYDWAGLVRWTMRLCAFPEQPLPKYREALDDFTVDISSYEALDRVNWYGKRLADTGRTQLQLQLSFAVPMHGSTIRSSSANDHDIKARSWVRANIATPQSTYNAHRAHEKLNVIGEDLLAKVVRNFVQQENLKMRKIKRQLPGRNYTFTKKFAKHYKRPFELEDFMVATTVKKELDTAFANEDPEKRVYSISRCEEDGSIMAIMSLLADGKVKLVPHLPLVNNEFGAPLPRLSKWGFCEGDYVHRSIDRNRVFWDTHVVPTPAYQFGSTIQPLDAPMGDWPSLPDPPLPGKHNCDALLPIWSSIDGQSVTWPWWYRILNLVLQPLFLQPGASTANIYSHCPEGTTELFEVQLVLDWLESLGAVTKTLGGGYSVTLGFWASFGDRLLDSKDDIFGQYVKRNTKSTVKQQWRDKYNMQYSKLQMHRSPNDVQRDTLGPHNVEMRQQIIGNSRAQYSILQQVIHDQLSSEAQGQSLAQAKTDDATEGRANGMQAAENSVEQVGDFLVAEETDASLELQGERTPSLDHEMVHVDDVDAIGEVDDETY
ncbi:hypothetical protein ACEQ8H_006580 [Pleosporales sp. CAS-2024a]